MINVVLIPIFIWINYWIHFWDLLHLTIGQFSLTKFSEYYQLLVMQEVSTIFAVFVLWVIFEFLLLELILLVVGVVLLVELLQNLASMFFQNPTHHHKHNNNKHHNAKNTCIFNGNILISKALIMLCFPLKNSLRLQA